MKEGRLSGEVVVVVGGSSGIGLSIAGAAREAGASVVVAGRSREKLERAQELLGKSEEAEEAEGEGRALRGFQVDVLDESSVRELFAEVGSVDHLLVTAAETEPADLRASGVDSLRATLDIRVWGGFNAARHAASRMDGGSITFFSGLSALRPYVGSSVIAASCGAIEAFSRSLALELAPVRVNTIAPGIIETPLLDDFYGEDREGFLEDLAARLPSGRVGKPEDIADAALFLMQNGFVTGSTLRVDGGGSLT